MPQETSAIKDLRQRYPGHNVHQGEVFGIPVWMFYTVHPEPYPSIEDAMIFTAEGIPADWVPDSEVRHMEDDIFAAHKRRGKLRLC